MKVMISDLFYFFQTDLRVGLFYDFATESDEIYLAFVFFW